MKNFIITELKKDYKVLITLLNYEVPISKCLKEIKLNDKTEQKILVDSATKNVELNTFLINSHSHPQSGESLGWRRGV